MARRKSKVGGVLFGPVLVIAGCMALWQNEGRFDYYEAARDAAIVTEPTGADANPGAYTGRLRTDIPIAGEYVVRFDGYHVVERAAEIYSWDESSDSDGNTQWSKGWHSTLESNSRNSGLTQRLSSRDLYPERYELDGLTIHPTQIQIVDAAVRVPLDELELSDAGRDLGLRRDGDYLVLAKGRDDGLGDERIRYLAVPNAPTASYFGQILRGSGMARQYRQEVGWIAAIIGDVGILHHLVNGEREEALEKIRADLKTKTWLTRAGGTAAIVFGLAMFLGAFASLLYRIPLLGPLVQGGVFLVSLVVGVTLALTVMGTALVFHNPVTLALPLLALAVGAAWLLRRSKRAGRNAREALDQRLAEPAPSRAREAVSSLGGDASSAPAPIASDGAPASAPAPAPAAAAGAAATASAANPVIEQTFMNIAALALAEGELHRREKRLLEGWAERNGIGAERMQALIEKARTDPPEMHRATREDLEILALVAMADGALMQSELRRLSKVAERVGVGAAELRRMLIDIENGQLEPA